MANKYYYLLVTKGGNIKMANDNDSMGGRIKINPSYEGLDGECLITGNTPLHLISYSTPHLDSIDDLLPSNEEIAINYQRMIEVRKVENAQNLMVEIPYSEERVSPLLKQMRGILDETITEKPLNSEFLEELNKYILDKSSAELKQYISLEKNKVSPPEKDSFLKMIKNHFLKQKVTYLAVGELVISGYFCNALDKSSEEDYTDMVALRSGDWAEVTNNPENIDSVLTAWQELRPTISEKELQTRMDEYSGNYEGRESLFAPTSDQYNGEEYIFIDGEFILKP